MCGSSPLQSEVIVGLCFRDDVLPQLHRREAGPGGVVSSTRHTVAALAVLPAGHQLISWQMGHGVREGAQEAVEEVAHGRGQS